MVKNLPVNAGLTGSLGPEDPLEEEMVTHSWYSCLGNPIDRGTWWATAMESQSQTLSDENFHFSA